MKYVNNIFYSFSSYSLIYFNITIHYQYYLSYFIFISIIEVVHFSVMPRLLSMFVLGIFSMSHSSLVRLLDLALAILACLDFFTVTIFLVIGMVSLYCQSVWNYPLNIILIFIILTTSKLRCKLIFSCLNFSPDFSIVPDLESKQLCPLHFAKVYWCTWLNCHCKACQARLFDFGSAIKRHLSFHLLYFFYASGDHFHQRSHGCQLRIFWQSFQWWNFYRFLCWGLIGYWGFCFCKYFEKTYEQDAYKIFQRIINF